MSTQPRIQPGVRTGGQYTFKAHAESPELWADRGSALAVDGYVPAVAHTTIRAAGRRDGVQTWWANHFASGEWNVPSGDYPKLPDDNTPGMHGGAALSGHRRTHRMRYHFNGVDVRMPSKTAVRRFAAEGHRTFDVPYSVTDEWGVSHSGWMRVSGPQAGLWDVQALGVNSQNVQQLAKAREVVHATLEGRRPEMDVSDVGAILRHARRQRAAAGVTVAPTKQDSSWIKKVGYGDNTGVMVIETDRRAYGFRVDPKLYAELRDSHSPGRTFNYEVKGKKAGVKVEQCGSCQRYTSDMAAHHCPITPGARETEPSAFSTNAKGRAASMLRPRRQDA